MMAMMQTGNNCGCCEGLSTQTPVKVYNRPGLKAIAYRVGIHPQFKRSMLASLSGSGQPSLQNLTTREHDDFSVALLDAWATVSDVLTFYQERIANESYLNTATERFSVLELARLIGYELRPGVAANTYLAFTIEDTPGALTPASPGSISKNARIDLSSVSIDPGVKLQSIPGPGEQAQVFENVEKIEARAEWNVMRPRLHQLQHLSVDKDIVVLKGMVNNLRKGDVVLIKHSGASAMRKIMQVKIDEENKTTRVTFTAKASLPVFKESPSVPTGNLNNFKQKTLLDQKALNDVVDKTWREEDLSALIKIQGWSAENLSEGIIKAVRPGESSEVGFFVFRKQAFPFGYNAPCKVIYSNEPPVFTEWMLDEEPGKVYLDNAYEEILPGSYIAIQRPGVSIEMAAVEKIEAADVHSRSAYGISAKTTLLGFSLKEPWWKLSTPEREKLAADSTLSTFEKRAAAEKLSAIRGITIYAQTEQIELADLPVEDVVKGFTVTLDRLYLGLNSGRKIMLTGDRSDLEGVTSTELMTLKDVIIAEGYTVLTFNESLDYSYIRNSVTINANVALATHGETVGEVLGSGDATKPFQKFLLRQPPLTYTSANTPEGTATTLEIRVNDLLWKEVPSFLYHGPKDRIFVTRLDNEGNTSVIFGDGKTGSCLPTGKENIKAKYRKGIGSGGLVRANQISQLMTRPHGVKAGHNPLASSGAEDRESLENARRNAPLAIRTLGRIVSLQDYEDFARAFAGIDKSQATWTWCGQRRCIYLTVAGSNGAIILKDSILHTNLLSAMQKAGDPNVPLEIETYQPRCFRLTATIQVNADYVAAKVLSAAENKLRAHFSFAAREFGQPVSYSEVVSTIQEVEGVTAVDIDELYRTDGTAGLKHYLESKKPIPGHNKVFAAAELLTLDPGTVNLNVIQ